eukprot:14871941-Ditylum_brightwellii.AAC.1
MVPCFDCKDSDAANSDCKDSGTSSTLRMLELEAATTINLNGYLKWCLAFASRMVMLTMVITYNRGTGSALRM